MLAKVWARGALISLILAAGPLAGGQSSGRGTITLRADRECGAVPVSIRVRAPRAGLAPAMQELGSGRTVPCQMEPDEGGDRVWWVVPGLKRGQERNYRLSFRRAGTLAAELPVSLVRGDNAVEVYLDGQRFTRYVFAGGPRPYCYPLIGPTGQPVTRSYPMEEVAGEPKDHPHHRSFWFTHGEVNGHDFWSDASGAGRIVHRGFEALRSGPVFGLIRARNDWIARDGTRVCEDVRELRVFHVGADERLFDFAVWLRATEGPVELGDTKEGSLGLRVVPPMQVAQGQGHIQNARGDRDTAAWGKRAEWCDYYGPVGGQTVGVAILDHPQSFRHPTYWHVRDYGLFAANPFGIGDFTEQQGDPGRYMIPKGGTLALRYRIILHRGTTEEANIARRFADYAQPPQPAVRP